MLEKIDLKDGLAALANAIKNAPREPGIYKMVSANETLLYIGKAKNIQKRLSQYQQISRLSSRLRLMISLLKKVETLITENEAAALLLEANFIRNNKPQFNVALKDDKSFPYIVIEEKHEFPRILKYRGVKKEKSVYYGPFANVDNLEITIKELQKIFLLRSCTDNYFKGRTQPCLLYQIKRCSAPCVYKITPDEYKKSVQQAKRFLSGESKRLQIALAKTMEKASDNLEFEKAAMIRDKIKLLSQMQAKNAIMDYAKNSEIHIFTIYKDVNYACIQVFFMREGQNYGNQPYFLEDIDALDYQESVNLFITQFYHNRPLPEEIWTNLDLEQIAIIQGALAKLAEQKGETDKKPPKVLASNKSTRSVQHIMEFAIHNTREALSIHKKEHLKKLSIFTQLQELFSLSTTPNRIEVYDNSHIQGEYAVGCMVVAGINGFIKSQYRKFKIKWQQNTAIGGDDYRMLQEVLMRRLNYLQVDNFPNILLIDGGPGHFSVAHQILEEKGLATKIKLVCIAKGPKHNAGEEWLYLSRTHKFQLQKQNPVLFYLQTLRDEAHRFAITTHRKERTKQSLKSVITSIPGIGKIKQKLLLNVFGSFEGVCHASFHELKSIEKLGSKCARTIYRHLHTKKDV